MSQTPEMLQAPLWVLRYLGITGSQFLQWFTNVGITHVHQILPMRVFDYLNLNHIDNNVAEEVLLCLYRFIYPERQELDDWIGYHEIDQPIDLFAWEEEITCKNITVGALLAKDQINEAALSQIFYFISQNFYKSDEYDWHEYRYYDYADYLRHL